MFPGIHCARLYQFIKCEALSIRKCFTEIKVSPIVTIIALGSFLLIFSPSAVLARDPPQGRCQLVPEQWIPSLNQVMDYIEESSQSEAHTSQRQLTQANQHLADLRDAQLFITYIQLMQTLDIRGQTNLYEEQKRWLSKRAELARASVISKGGTLEPLEYSSSFRKITEERLAELQEQLQQQVSATKPSR